MSTARITLTSTPIPTSVLVTPGPQSSIDEFLTSFLSTWSLTSTLILLSTLSFLLYPLFFSKDPDTHPFLLARQSQPAPIRQPNESAVYRALDVPHGYPLRNSLGVRDKGMAKWSPGRQGDLRDVWRVAANGPVGQDGEEDGRKVGKMMTVLGREGVESVEMDEVTALINGLGGWVSAKGEGKKVAVCLSNSVELMVCVFAAAFNNISLTLIPFGLPASQTLSLLAQVTPDLLITEAGTLDLTSLLSSSKSIRDVVLVTKGGSKHMDWDEGAPQGANVTTWDKVAASGASRVVPALDKQTKPRPLGLFCSVGHAGYELVEFTSENLVSGIAGLGATIARDNKLTTSDILLPTTSLTESYTLCWTLAALYANVSIAFNSVAGDRVDLGLCTQGIQPTVIVAAPGTIQTYIDDATKSGRGPGMVGKYFANSSLQAGVMPTKRPTAAISSLSRVRLMVIAQPASQRSRLSSSTLHQLRLLSGSKVMYGLTAPNVAGAICQTNVHDYRNKGDVVCVGPPLGSVEVHMVGEEEKLGDATPQGRLVVKGPSIGGGKVELDTVVSVDTDHTLRLI